MKFSKATVVYAIFFLICVQMKKSLALLYIVRQDCVRGSVFTPTPSAVSNICLQCVCVVTGISYCKPLVVQLSIICSAAATIAPPPTTTMAPTTTTTARLTVPTTASTATPVVGINPRASSPTSTATMANLAPVSSNMMMSMMQPMMMIMMASATAGMSSMAPAPAPSSNGR